MSWQDFFAALALALVLEGILPFVSPRNWREMARMLSEQDDAALRRMGLIIMSVGVVFLYLVRD